MAGNDESPNPVPGPFESPNPVAGHVEGPNAPVDGHDERAAHLDDVAIFRTAWWQRLAAEPATYELTRFSILRLLGFVYFVAFFSLWFQLEPLFGWHGLLPAAQLLSFKHAQLHVGALWRLPTIFWFGSSDAALRTACAVGVALSIAAMCGVTNAAVQLALFVLYSSFVHVGQIFYGYGWEIQLIETGFLAVFLCPWTTLGPFPRSGTSRIVIGLLRWLIFRIMLGSALIKLRGDPCWRDLTCLDTFFETQPNPNPLSWWMHHAPHAAHVAGVLFTYLAELVAPWFAFAFRRTRHAAGVVLVAFQISLILTGNLSFLNWLTIVPALACFDDTAFVRLVPRSLRERLLDRFTPMLRSRAQTVTATVLAVVVGLLSVGPVGNLASNDQRMNASFDPLDLVNTYGAFGGVDRDRFEVILEGTADDSPTGAKWQEYELPCMPGDVRRRPCIVAPYHYRLDWQMWFVGNDAASGERIDEPWLVHLVWQLLEGEPWPKSLFAHDPFPHEPPHWIRAGIWHYRFSASHEGGAWWVRERVGEFLPPISLGRAGLRDYVASFEWPDADSL